MGIGPRFLSWVRLLYTDPIARIQINRLLSTPFALLRGMRQGCPLSPLLFALAVEPLACLIRSSPEITGFRIGTLEERISLYAAILPVDPLPPSLPPEAVPLQIVPRFKYFRIVVSPRPKDYFALNLLPTLHKLSSEVDTWCRLPLPIVGDGLPIEYYCTFWFLFGKLVRKCWREEGCRKVSERLWWFYYL